MEQLMITIWIVWTLLSGQPVDVNTYMNQDMCERQLAESREMLKSAKAQHKDVPDFALLGCYALDVSPPVKT